jgi:hypothetical protein
MSRRRCCDTGLCMTHLAEKGVSASTLRLPGVTMMVPNYGKQELVIAFTKAIFNWMREQQWKMPDRDR